MIELRSGCRIHFGLVELAECAPHRYAGLGVMLAQPSLQIRISNAPDRSKRDSSGSFQSSQTAGEFSQRIERWSASRRQQEFVEILHTYPFHAGLGAGTQLAALLTVGGMLLDSGKTLDSQWRSIDALMPQLDPLELSKRSGRGARSGIGVHGFFKGGLILDSGFPNGVKHPTNRTTSFPIPTSWKFVLIRSRESSGITGNREHELLRHLAQHPNPHRRQMWELAESACQAAQRTNFAAFAEHLEGYLDYATRLFEPIQGGKFNGPACELAAAAVQSVGLRGVGQSSWGPTIFGIAPDQDSAQTAADALRKSHPAWTIEVAPPSPHGAEARRVFVE